MSHHPELFERFVLDHVEQLRREASAYDQLRLAQRNAGPSRFTRLVFRLAALVRGTDRRAATGDEAWRDGACDVACPERLAGTCRCAQLGRAM